MRITQNYNSGATWTTGYVDVGSLQGKKCGFNRSKSAANSFEKLVTQKNSFRHKTIIIHHSVEAHLIQEQLSQPQVLILFTPKQLPGYRTELMIALLLTSAMALDYLNQDQEQIGNKQNNNSEIPALDLCSELSKPVQPDNEH